MSSKKSSSNIDQTSKTEAISNDFYKRIYIFQDELLESGKNFIRYWLRDADEEGEFEEAIDWMLGADAGGLIKQNKGVFSFEIAAYAWNEFLNEEDEDENRAGDEDASIYERVRVWFDV
ncbi:hypothetical protein ICN48_08095 [Polynucleobacter sp. JS-Safj-400b-B2]|jgi:hypothetical protein|uniref:hypothetical protein n=1 Tax=Polynucleobacter sp. JS-Safj-400b-B2 TaxID=2576921 RepID=UPI001C0E17E4|nr:hypothetical protein [Polynucleobacter sp. JS-Safj-400b-B2]MBU3626191.1 hypothetical protein [Polynucleobacter sp. JS-Safj-400b-B2]